MGLGSLLNGALTTSLLALPAGALQFSIFRLAKAIGREAAPPWVSVTSVELVAGQSSQFSISHTYMHDLTDMTRLPTDADHPCAENKL